MHNINHFRNAGRAGGLARVRKYGNPGTPEGRRKGGLRSIQVQKKLGNNFKQLKDIVIPDHSVELAELIGIFMGDGHVDTYQASVTTHAETDLQHAKYTQYLISKLFDIPTEFRFRKGIKACVVVVSSKKFCEYLRSQGLSHCNKVHGGLFIPSWIQENNDYARALVRGLFDTDGSAYIDHHIRKSKLYQYMSLAFCSRSLVLLHFFKQVLIREGLHPTQKTRFTVFLRRETDIRQYFKIIGSSNSKHIARIASLF